MTFGGGGCGPRIPAGPAPARIAARPLTPRTVAASAEGPVILGAAVAAGSAHDPIGQEGLAWRVAHALVPAGREAAWEVEVSRDWALFRVTCAPVEGPACAAELSGALAQAPDDEVRWQAMGTAASAARAQLEATSASLASLVLEGLLFEGHRYGHPAEGRGGVADVLDLRAAQAFHAARYVNIHTAVGVAGRWDEATREALTQAAEAIPVGPARLRPLFRPPVVDHREIVVVEAPPPKEASLPAGAEAGEPEVGAEPPPAVPLVVALGHPIHADAAEIAVLAAELSTREAAHVEVSLEPGDASVAHRQRRLSVVYTPPAGTSAVDAVRTALEMVEGWREPAPGAAQRPVPDPGLALGRALAPEPLDPHAPGPDAAGVLTAHLRPEELQIVVVTPQVEAAREALEAAAEGLGVPQVWVLPPGAVAR